MSLKNLQWHHLLESNQRPSDLQHSTLTTVPPRSPQISDNEIYLLIKYIKSVLWRVVKPLSYIEDAVCLKVKCTACACRPLLLDFITLPTDDIVKSTNYVLVLPLQFSPMFCHFLPPKVQIFYLASRFHTSQSVAVPWCIAKSHTHVQQVDLYCA